MLYILAQTNDPLLISQAMRMFSDLIFTSVKIMNNDVPVIILAMISLAAFFTLYFKGVNIWGFTHALRLVKGDFSNKDAPGEVSHFAALCTAVAGTVGVGNIGAVAIAIFLAGPGACFWIIIAGLLGMTTKFVECTLGVMYREENADLSLIHI